MKSVYFCSALLLCSIFVSPPVLAGISVEDSSECRRCNQLLDVEGSVGLDDNSGTYAGTADAESVFALGVDISGAGSTPRAQAAFFNELPEFQQANVRTRCIAMAAVQAEASTPPVRAFCDAVLRSK